MKKRVRMYPTLTWAINTNIRQEGEKSTDTHTKDVQSLANQTLNSH